MFAPLKQSLQTRVAVSSFHSAWSKLLLPAAKASSGPMSVDRVCPSSAASQSRHIHSANTCHAWDGLGTQEELMAKDQCILVTEADEICGHASKYDAHRFNSQQPQGLLHRAFSVFLFNSKNKLLLQQRAPGKITFPSVWTNTCCSHPLYGQDPPEVDLPTAVRSGTVEGAKTAAVRKLQHELGIHPSQLPISSFKYLTRLHYVAADSGTYGPNASWGEHELDYILFARADVDIQPNPEEVCATKYVSLHELQHMMEPEQRLLWSPWFKIIASNFLEHWWTNLDQTLTSDAMMDVQTIHKIVTQ